MPGRGRCSCSESGIGRSGGPSLRHKVQLILSHRQSFTDVIPAGLSLLPTPQQPKPMSSGTKGMTVALPATKSAGAS